MAAMTMDWNNFFKKLLMMAGNILAVMSGVSFFFNCMLLPLVGPSGSQAPNSVANLVIFICVSILTFSLSAGAAVFKMIRSAVDGSRLPYYSFVLCAVCVLFVIFSATGLFAI